MRNLKKLREESGLTIVSEHGEVVAILPKLESRKKEKFIIVFVGNIESLPALVLKITRSMDYGNIAFADKGDRVTLYRYCKMGYLKHLGGMTYMVNPYMMGVGTWKGIIKNRERWDSLQ